MLYTKIQKMSAYSDSSRAGAVYYHFYLVYLLADNLKSVYKRCGNNYGSAVLVVVKYGYITDFL